MSVKVTDKNFDEVTKQGLVLVDFWATWCPPCRYMDPILEEVEQEIEDLTVAKLDVDENPVTSQKFGVQSIPTMILFKDGKIVPSAVMVGARPKDAVKTVIASA